MSRNFLIIILMVMLLCCNKITKEKLLPLDINNLADKENNDNLSKSNIVSSQDPIIGFFNNKDNVGDKDYYKVKIAIHNVSYKIILTAVPGIDSKITIFSPTNEKIISVDEGGKGEAERIINFCPVTDYVILLVEAKIGYNEKVPYVINFIPNNNKNVDEIEPNNTKETATEIKLNETKKGLIFPKDDTDFYKIIIDDNKIHDFSIKVEPFSDMDINFTLYDEHNNQVFINNYSWGGTEIYPFLSNKNGNFYIKVAGNYSSYDKKDPIYQVKIEELQPNQNGKDLFYEREFNNTKEQATDLLNGKEIIGAFFPENDEDWFKFDLVGNALSIDISLSSIRDVNPIIEIYNEKMELIKKVNENKVDSGENLTLNALYRGKYYIKLFSDKRSLLTYKLFFISRYE